MDRIPKVSVIIPFYNGMEHICETVSSVKELSCDKEILIIDDGSTDGSLECLRRLYDSDDEIRIFTKENAGIADTRNFGLSCASGEYILFCDQDDRIVASVIEKAINTMDSESCDMAFWSTTMSYEASRNDKECDTVLYDGIIMGEDIRDVLLVQILTRSESVFGKRFSHLWMGIYRKNFITGNGIIFKSYIAYDDDLLFLIDAVSFAEKIFMEPDVGYKWLQNYGSKSHNNDYVADGLARNIKHFSYYEEVMDRTGMPEEKREMIRVCTEQICIADSLINWASLPRGDEKKRQFRLIRDHLRKCVGSGCLQKDLLSNEPFRERIISFVRRRLYFAVFMYSRHHICSMRTRRKLRSIYDRIRE